MSIDKALFGPLEGEDFGNHNALRPPVTRDTTNIHCDTVGAAAGGAQASIMSVEPVVTRGTFSNDPHRFYRGPTVLDVQVQLQASESC